jgi:phage recombination protein Bet
MGGIGEGMNDIVTITPKKKLSEMLAERFNVDAKQFINTVKATCFNNQQVSDEQFLQFLMVTKEYNLNPFTKEIYAFPGKGGGIQPIVSIDGWLNIINSHPQFDGMEFEDKLNPEGKLLAVTCKMYRKDRNHPVEVTEYMSECVKNSEPWKQWPARMLRHKATIQAARYAFGFSGISDPDEAERTTGPIQMGNAEVVSTEVAEFEKELEAEKGAVA